MTRTDMAHRAVLHVDMDAYFASVEVLAHPRWKGKPVVVAGPSLRSVVSACSYEAKRLGVRSGMPLVRAMRMAPEAIYTQGHLHSYASYTRRILRILVGFTPLVEPVSIDEAFLDVTGAPSSPEELAGKIQASVLSETRLWASVGMGPNKLLAKMASRGAKPRGIGRLTPDTMVDLPVDSIWGVGEETGKLFRRFGIRTIADLRVLSRRQLRALLGRSGEVLYFLCRGVDPSPVVPGEEAPPPLSIGNEYTFPHDVRRPAEYLPALSLLAQKVARRARDKGFRGFTVTFRYRLRDLSCHSRRRQLPRATDQRGKIFTVAAGLAREAVGSPVRLVGVKLSDLVPERARQLELFPGGGERVSAVVDAIRRKYGEASITCGRTMVGLPDRSRIPYHGRGTPA
ncbi:DNA polymerase IV [Candidatus Fermentibacteria bacterium]|nr:DNA polymerase IV [Candidatus Fermentibacteria bacterium]